MQIWVAIPKDYQDHVSGPIDVTIAVPAEVDSAIKNLDSGFNGHGETVTFIKPERGNNHEFDAQIMIEIPMDFADQTLAEVAAVSVQVEVIYDGKSIYFYGAHNGMKADVHVVAS